VEERQNTVVDKTVGVYEAGEGRHCSEIRNRFLERGDMEGTRPRKRDCSSRETKVQKTPDVLKRIASGVKRQTKVVKRIASGVKRQTKIDAVEWGMGRESLV
jgi:hypothetical protein